MKIVIDSLEMPYNFLRSIEVGPGSLGEGLGEELVEENRKTNLILFKYTSITLPEPLDDLTIIFKRFGENYSGVVPIDSLNLEVFEDVGDRLSKNFREHDYKFVVARKEPELVGALYDSEGKCAFDIVAANNSSMRVIAMGSHGACTKKFPEDLDRFIEEVGNLEGIVNLFLGSLLDPLKENRDDLKFLDGKIRYLNP